MFEKKDSRVKSAAATNLSFLYYLVSGALPAARRSRALSRLGPGEAGGGGTVGGRLGWV